MEPRLNEETGIVTGTVQDKINYLLNKHQKMSDLRLNKARKKTIHHMYVHSNPIADVFTIIWRYGAIAESKETPKNQHPTYQN